MEEIKQINKDLEKTLSYYRSNKNNKLLLVKKSE